jgi:hypothetical protein
MKFGCLSFFYYCFIIIHMCIQGLGHVSPQPPPPPLPPTPPPPSPPHPLNTRQNNVCLVCMKAHGFWNSDIKNVSFQNQASMLNQGLSGWVSFPHSCDDLLVKWDVETGVQGKASGIRKVPLSKEIKAPGTQKSVLCLGNKHKSLCQQSSSAFSGTWHPHKIHFYCHK